MGEDFPFRYRKKTGKDVCMERTKTLCLDFSSTTPCEFYCESFAGDMHSLAIELEVTPVPENGEILLCSFLREGTPVDTVVVKDNRLTVPYSVLKEPGAYTAAFALADMESRLTATALLTVRVAEDRVLLTPDEDGQDTSFVCYLLEQAAATARAAAGEALTEVNGRIDTLAEETRSELYVQDQMDAALTARLDNTDGRLSALTERVAEAEIAATQAVTQLQTYADGRVKAVSVPFSLGENELFKTLSAIPADGYVTETSGAAVATVSLVNPMAHPKDTATFTAEVTALCTCTVLLYRHGSDLYPVVVRAGNGMAGSLAAISGTLNVLFRET